jgi:hypothetical protein
MPVRHLRRRMSKVVQNHRYNAQARKLTIDFTSGKTYEYDGVPPEAYEAFVAAESKGKHFGEHIRGQYPHKLVEPAA